MQTIAALINLGFACAGAVTVLFAFAGGPDPSAICPKTDGSGGDPYEAGVWRASSGNLEHRALADHLSHRYRIAPEAIELLVGAAFDAGHMVDLDPLVILAVMAIESRFNPIANSDAGAKGLMQIIPKYHLAKLMHHGGEEAVLLPAKNILLGAQILKEYISLTGSLEAGLQLYNGALSDKTRRYAIKILAETQRLKSALHDIERKASDASPG